MPALSNLDCAGIFLFCVRIFRISEKLAEIESFLPKCRQADHKSAKILAFHKAVVAALILYLQDAGRLHAHIIQRVALGVHAEQVSVLVLMAAAQGHLHTDGGIIAVIEIAEAFKDIPLVVRPRQTAVGRPHRLWSWRKAGRPACTGRPGTCSEMGCCPARYGACRRPSPAG